MGIRLKTGVDQNNDSFLQILLHFENELDGNKTDVIIIQRVYTILGVTLYLSHPFRGSEAGSSLPALPTRSLLMGTFSESRNIYGSISLT